MDKVKLLFIVSFLLIPVNVYAWYYPGWNYRTPITIKYTGIEDVYDFPYNLTIDTASLISAGKMNSDCSDIRFTYVNATTGEEQEILFYVNTTTCNTNSTIIYVRIPYIPKNLTYNETGMAMLFNGQSSYILIPNVDSFTYSFTDKSVCLWFKANDTINRQVLYEEGGNVNGMNLYIYNGSVWFGAWSESKGWDGAWISYPIEQGRWYFVCGIFEGNVEMRLYVNGTLVNSTIIPTTMYDHSDENALGALYDQTKFENGDFVTTGPDLFFNGTIDEFIVFNRVLTSNEIMQMYLRGYDSISWTDILLYWPFDDGTAKDVSGNGIDGTAYDTTPVFPGIKGLTGNTTITLYIYYGNPAASSTSSFDALKVLYDDFISLDNWIIFRSAGDPSSECYLDSTNDLVYLTTAASGKGCMMFYKERVIPFYVRFKYLIGGGSGADGMAFAFDKDISPFKTYGKAASGGSMGLYAIDPDSGNAIISDGYALEFDCYKNGGDPTENHIAIIRTNMTLPFYHIAYYDDTGTLYTEDNDWHIAEITFNPLTDSISNVTIDNNIILLNVTLTPFGYYWIGFGAGTGGLTNNHILDWVEVYGLKLIDPWPVFTLGSEEEWIGVGYNITSPVNNSYYYKEVYINFTVYVYGKYSTIDEVTILLNDSAIITYYNVANGTFISYRVELADGYYYVTIKSTVANVTFYSDPVYFYVDTVPPNVTIVEPKPITYRIHTNNQTIPLYVTATDNYQVKNCTITLWNGTTLNKCNAFLYLDITGLPEGNYTIQAIAYDEVGLSDAEEVIFTIDRSTGYVVYDVVNYPGRIPATEFNITANITCLGDWCEHVESKLIEPVACDIISVNPIDLGDMEEFETRTVYWTVKCIKDVNYTFTINTTVANGYFTIYQFTALAPELNIYISPENPTEDDNIVFMVEPVGYGRDITIEYKIIRYRAGVGAVTLIQTNSTIPSDINTTLYTVSSSDTNPGDIYVFQVRLVDPLEFYVEAEKNVTVYDGIPPNIVDIKLKYAPNTPHDILQNVSFIVQDNHMIYRVELFVDFGNGTYVLYSSKNYDTYLISDYFLVNHTAFIGKTIKLFIVVYDWFNNTVVSDVLEYAVVKNQPPSIYIQQPVNNSVFNTTEITVAFKATDDFTTDLVCTVDGEEINVTSGELAATVIKVEEFEHNITISCRDGQGNTNSNFVKVYVDTVDPIVENISYTVQDSTVLFNITAVDNFLLKEMHVYTIVNDSVVDHNIYQLTGNHSIVSFTKSFVSYAGQIVGINITVIDAAGNREDVPTIHFAVSPPKVTPAGVYVTVNMPPKITIKSYKLFPRYIVELLFRVEDESSTVFCELKYDSSSRILGYINTKEDIYYNVSVGKPGIYRFVIMCTDPDGLRGISNTLIVNVTYIPEKPETYLDVYAKAITLADKRLSSPIGLGIALTVLGVVIQSTTLIMSGVSLIIGGPLLAYGLLEGDPVASIAGVVTSALVWLVLDILLKRRIP